MDSGIGWIMAGLVLLLIIGLILWHLLPIPPGPPAPPVVAPPTGVTLVPAVGTVTVSWTPPVGITMFQVSASAPSGPVIFFQPVTGTSALIPLVVLPPIFVVAVRSVSGELLSVPATVAFVPPPTNLTATRGATNLVVTWVAPSVTGVNLFRVSVLVGTTVVFHQDTPGTDLIIGVARLPPPPYLVAVQSISGMLVGPAAVVSVS